MTKEKFEKTAFAGGQFKDRGHSYTTAISYYTDAQREIANTSKKKLAESSLFATPIHPAETFYDAEELL